MKHVLFLLKKLCEIKRTEMVLKTLVYSPFNPLTWRWPENILLKMSEN